MLMLIKNNVGYYLIDFVVFFLRTKISWEYGIYSQVVELELGLCFLCAELV